MGIHKRCRICEHWEPAHEADSYWGFCKAEQDFQANLGLSGEAALMTRRDSCCDSFECAEQYEDYSDRDWRDDFDDYAYDLEQDRAVRAEG